MATVAHPGSFRDPAGHIFTKNGTVYRLIAEAGRVDYDKTIESGLYEALTGGGLMVAHEEVSPKLADGTPAYKVIRPERIPFISYPYEWSFAQLKDAALLTLKIQKRALEHGMILKDASAYNVQFIGRRPVFIDTLSFKAYEPGEAWEGYRQFCEHFLAPLALARYSSYDALKLLCVDLEGLSLELATRLLPRRARLKPGLFSHLYLHNASQKKYQNAASEKPGEKVAPRKVSKFALEGIIASLERSIIKLQPPREKTEWGEYYTFTNYSDSGFKRKHDMVKALLESVKPEPLSVWDIGANNGEFSSIAAEKGIYTVAFDIDPVAVERNYLAKAPAGQPMLPLVQDCVNPSPANGFMGRERDSLFERGPADVVLALALIHHLAIGRNLPLDRVAEFLAAIGRHVIIEFVPKEDSKVKILLTSRRDIFVDYDAEHFEAAMGRYFTLTKKQPIKDTKRTLYLYKRKTTKVD